MPETKTALTNMPKTAGLIDFATTQEGGNHQPISALDPHTLGHYTHEEAERQSPEDAHSSPCATTPSPHDLGHQDA